MANLNKVLLIGNLTKDPELRYTPQGAAVCDFSLAINRSFTSKTGERRDDVTFVDIVAWARQAELCAEYLRKGRQVFVEGRLTLDRWEQPDGQKRSRLRVTAERVQFLGAPGGTGRGAPAEAAPEAPPEIAEEPHPDDNPKF